MFMRVELSLKWFLSELNTLTYLYPLRLGRDPGGDVGAPEGLEVRRNDLHYLGVVVVVPSYLPGDVGIILLNFLEAGVFQALLRSNELQLQPHLN